MIRMGSDYTEFESQAEEFDLMGRHLRVIVGVRVL
jgi:hypothetical protein